MNEELLKLINRPEVQEKRGEWQVGDRYLFPDGSLNVYFVTRPNPQFERPKLWLPLPIDPINKERGVWEWIDWSKARAIIVSPGELYCYPNYNKCSICFTGNPLEVLLKVFLWQKGIET